jgi:hypothetical protein
MSLSFLISDDELRRMKLGDALLWAADADGYLTNIKKLERVAKARRYHPGWVRHCYEQHWREVVGRTKRYRGQQRKELIEQRKREDFCG